MQNDEEHRDNNPDSIKNNYSDTEGAAPLPHDAPIKPPDPQFYERRSVQIATLALIVTIIGIALAVYFDVRQLNSTSDNPTNTSETTVPVAGRPTDTLTRTPTPTTSPPGSPITIDIHRDSDSFAVCPQQAADLTGLEVRFPEAGLIYALNDHFDLTAAGQCWCLEQRTNNGSAYSGCTATATEDNADWRNHALHLRLPGWSASGACEADPRNDDFFSCRLTLTQGDT